MPIVPGVNYLLHYLRIDEWAIGRQFEDRSRIK